MAVTPAKAKKLALSLEGVSEAPHFDRTAFRRRTIFATLGAGSDLNLMFDPDLRDFYVEQEPAAFSEHPSEAVAPRDLHSRRKLEVGFVFGWRQHVQPSAALRRARSAQRIGEIAAVAAGGQMPGRNVGRSALDPVQHRVHARTAHGAYILPHRPRDACC